MSPFRFRPSCIFNLYGGIERPTYAEVVALTAPNPTAFRWGSVSSLDELKSILDTELYQRGGVLKVNERTESLGDSFL